MKPPAAIILPPKLSKSAALVGGAILGAAIDGHAPEGEEGNASMMLGMLGKIFAAAAGVHAPMIEAAAEGAFAAGVAAKAAALAKQEEPLVTEAKKAMGIEDEEEKR